MTPPMAVSAVLALHDAALQAHGGTPGHGQGVACVDRSLCAAVNAVLYRFGADDDCLDPKWFAAYAFLYLLKNHCFTDGNKRVAWMVLTQVLFQELGASVSFSDDVAVRLVLDFDNRSKSGSDFSGLITELVALLDQHLVAASEA